MMIICHQLREDTLSKEEQLDVHRLAKIANKSHRDRIQVFNKRLANMSEHYNIPKVGPG